MAMSLQAHACNHVGNHGPVHFSCPRGKVASWIGNKQLRVRNRMPTGLRCKSTLHKPCASPIMASKA
eukprot:1137999-Pelagomonas_calceolata.AAC.4